MRKQSAINGLLTKSVRMPADTLAVLSMSPIDEDHLSLEAILDHPTTMLFKAPDLVSAMVLLQQHEIAVVICERDLLPGSWTDVLDDLKALPIPPSLIVTSRLADERLWAEALNLGAWDVLAKPFDRNELIRTVESAWRHWHNQIQIPAA